MRNWELKRRLGGLADRMKDDSVQNSTRIDPDCLSEGEKRLFARVDEIIDEYGGAVLPDHVLAENGELLWKAVEIVVRRAVDLFSTVMPEAFGGGEIVKWYFKLHFYNFLVDWTECVANLNKWSEEDRREFLVDMKRDGWLDKVFRLHRGGTTDDVKVVEGDEEDDSFV